MGESEKLFCPQCEEPVRHMPPRIWATGTDRPAYSHRDGEPLCPVRTGTGHRPADPFTRSPAE
ncbi:hypothetical protein [Streptomonospora litoralis]|uniref:Uncharacterized protein n=1 Tax=Streptomonospora litoralis TaxID=2498135 RepID=A0A4P6Q4B4_9ACTN|nr:hypothetical protein [Streptomonospora litoralis]QBI55485.1 hypothetical protein EKD16_18605 [Streptomonospora litoralis]